MGRIQYQKAAGLEVKRGRPALTLTDAAKARLVQLYVREERSTRDIAAIMGRGDATIRRRLKAAGISLRSNAPRSRLRKLDQGRLFADLAEIGVDRTAAKWQIPERTLKAYLSGLRKASPKP